MSDNDGYCAKSFPYQKLSKRSGEVSIDERRLLQSGKGEKSYWRDYKGVRLQGIYYGTFFQDNLSLTDWINSQRLTNPLTCLGAEFSL